MFRKNDWVYYRHTNKSRELPVKDELAIFERIDSNGKACIFVKSGTEFKKRRVVNVKSLRLANEI